MLRWNPTRAFCILVDTLKGEGPFTVQQKAF